MIRFKVRVLTEPDYVVFLEEVRPEVSARSPIQGEFWEDIGQERPCFAMPSGKFAYASVYIAGNNLIGVAYLSRYGDGVLKYAVFEEIP